MAKRTIHVAAGRSHKRTIDAPTDKLALPIVERMTRSRLAKMTAEEEEEWKTESVNAILSLAPRKNDQASMSPSKRDGKIAAYMTWTPTPPRGKVARARARREHLSN